LSVEDRVYVIYEEDEMRKVYETSIISLTKNGDVSFSDHPFFFGEGGCSDKIFEPLESLEIIKVGKETQKKVKGKYKVGQIIKYLDYEAKEVSLKVIKVITGDLYLLEKDRIVHPVTEVAIIPIRKY